MKQIRTLLIEEMRILRDCITSLVSTQPDMRIVAACDGNGNILQVAHEVNPDLLLLGIGRGHQNSLQIVRSMKKESPELKVIGMGLGPAQTDIAEYVKAGASGLILKDATRSDCLGTIRAVVRGKTVIPQLLAGEPLSNVIDLASKKEGWSKPARTKMTNREREIMELIVERGLSNKEIARHLNVATFTIKSHVQRILIKLGVHSRLQIAVCIRKGQFPFRPVDSLFRTQQFDLPVAS